ncbi:uncharacterized protein LOC124166693 isoform X2 [Ischnura elegans]|uniref:uncharacterized protein LOC124166693 isoform X2 n=1 Tax=Ischnura elegans TaxID=197161 RepID=UPI001ED88808|nr:uncharacterized protein LOC124166693 isoform X2 [Ischnura elegans]
MEKITKEDHLSEFICVNCFKVNSFFKEFRKNCSEVNDYFKTCRTSSLPGNIIIKEEQLDDYEDQSVDPSKSQEENTSSISTLPYPVALVQSQRKDDLNQLRSKFLASKRAREEPSTALSAENRTVSPVRRAMKRKCNDSEGTTGRQRPRVDIPSEEDILNHIVKQEEVDISDSAVANEAYHEESVNEPWSPPDSRPSLASGNVGGLSSPDVDSNSSLSSCSSDDSDDDSDMLMLLALLL